jgi:hypothetical protein
MYEGVRMKTRHIMLLFLISLCFSTLSAQIGYVSPVIVFDDSDYPPGAFVTFYPKGIYPFQDGSTIVIGILDFEDELAHNIWSISAVKVDMFGNASWIRNFTDSFFISEGNVTCIDMDENGIIHFLGNSDASLKKYSLDQNGNLSTDFVLHVPCLNKIKRAIRLSNSDIAIACDIWSDDPYSTSDNITAAFLRISDSGDSLASQLYPPVLSTDQNENSNTFDMELDTDGLPIITCRFTYYKASIIKVDLDGELIFRSDINLNSGFYFPICITKLPANDYSLICFTSYIAPDGISGSFIYKLEGSELDSLYLYNPFQHTEVNHILEIPGGVLMSGNYSNSYTQRYFIGKFNLFGQAQWDSLFTSFPDCDGYNQSLELLQVTNDNCILGVFISAGVGFTLVKLLPDGTITGNQDEIAIPAPKCALSVFPNPIFQNTHIQLQYTQAPRKESQVVNVYNIRGQLVRKLTLKCKDSNLYEADWDGLNKDGVRCMSGVYVIRAGDEQAKVSKKVILIN